jgi:hypothetical protein
MLYYLKHYVFIPGFFYAAALVLGYFVILLCTPPLVGNIVNGLIAGATVGRWAIDIYDRID